MDYAYAALDLITLSRLAEHELAIERTRWLREHYRLEGRRRQQRDGATTSRSARRAAALRLLATPRSRRASITRAVRRVAGSLRALAATE